MSGSQVLNLATSNSRGVLSATLHIINTTFTTSIRTYLKIKIERALQLTTLFFFLVPRTAVFPHKMMKIAHPVQYTRIPLQLTNFSAFTLLTLQTYMGFGLLHQFIPGFSIFYRDGSNPSSLVSLNHLLLIRGSSLIFFSVCFGLLQNLLRFTSVEFIALIFTRLGHQPKAQLPKQ